MVYVKEKTAVIVVVALETIQTTVDLQTITHQTLTIMIIGWHVLPVRELETASNVTALAEEAMEECVQPVTVLVNVQLAKDLASVS